MEKNKNENQYDLKHIPRTYIIKGFNKDTLD